MRPDNYNQDQEDYFRRSSPIKAEVKIESPHPYLEKHSYRYPDHSKDLKHPEPDRKYELPREMKYDQPLKASKSSHRESRDRERSEIREKSPWRVADNFRPEELDPYRHGPSRKSVSPGRAKSQHITSDYYRAREMPHPESVFKSPEYRNYSSSRAFHRSSREQVGREPVSRELSTREPTLREPTLREPSTRDYRKDEDWRHHYRYGDPNYINYNHPSTSSSSPYSERDRYRRDDKHRHPREDLMKYPPRDDLKYPPRESLKYPREDLRYQQVEDLNLKYPPKEPLKSPHQETKYRHEKERPKFKKEEGQHNFPDYPRAMEGTFAEFSYRSENFKEQVLPKPDKKRKHSTSFSEISPVHVPLGISPMMSPLLKEATPLKEGEDEEADQWLSQMIPDITPFTMVSTPPPDPPLAKELSPTAAPTPDTAQIAEPSAPHRRSLDHLLPKPKYCSLLKQSFPSSGAMEPLPAVEQVPEILSTPVACNKPVPVFLDTCDLLKLSERIDPIEAGPAILEPSEATTSPVKDVPATPSVELPEPPEDSLSPEPVPAEDIVSKDLLGGMKKPTPSSPIILTTTRLKPQSARGRPVTQATSSEEEEGEILEEGEVSNTANAEEGEAYRDREKVSGITLKDILTESCEVTELSQSATTSTDYTAQPSPTAQPSQAAQISDASQLLVSAQPSDAVLLSDAAQLLDAAQFTDVVGEEDKKVAIPGGMLCRTVQDAGTALDEASLLW